MIHVDVKNLYDKPYTYLWSVLSFKAGFINSTGFLLTGSYVSHVTGFGSQIGISLGLNDYIFLGFELLLIPICFILGSFIASLVLDYQYDNNKIAPYPKVQFLITFLLGSLAFVSNNSYLSEQFQFIHNDKNILLIAILCLICGLKNGLTTWATHGKIRTTHLTGLSTDIGLHLTKLIKSYHQKCRFPERRKVNFTRILTFASFSFGAFLAAVLYNQLGTHLLTLAFVISAGLLMISITNYIHSASKQNTHLPIGGLNHENSH